MISDEMSEITGIVIFIKDYAVIYDAQTSELKKKQPKNKKNKEQKCKDIPILSKLYLFCRSPHEVRLAWERPF